MENYFNNYIKPSGYSMKDPKKLSQENLQNLTKANTPPTFTEGADFFGSNSSDHQIYEALGGNDTLQSFDSQYSKYYGMKGNDFIILDGVGYSPSQRTRPVSNWNMVDGGEGNDWLGIGVLYGDIATNPFGIGNFLLGDKGNDIIQAWKQDYVELSGGEGNDILDTYADDHFKAFGGTGNDYMIYQEHINPEGIRIRSGEGYFHGGTDNDTLKVVTIQGLINNECGENTLNLNKFKLNEKDNIVLLNNNKEVEIEKDIEEIRFSTVDDYTIDPVDTDIVYNYSDLVQLIKGKKKGGIIPKDCK